VRFEVLTVALKHMQVFWDVMLSQLINSYQHFTATRYLHLQYVAVQE